MALQRMGQIMWTIANGMIEEASRQGMFVGVLPPGDAAKIRQLAGNRHGKTSQRWPLWEHMDGPSFQEKQAWRRLSSFATDGGCIIFWEPRTEQQALRFHSTRDLTTILEECHRSEFYVTNDDVSYLLCFNEHDYLIGEGRAAEWIAQYLETLPSTEAR